ncbi:hypothetical protein [Streptomyces sp. NPDC003247]|uniref:hypothetical protein n=1 Tax=Streptomyces sp. NPDC003247 TaxID=3364677 RepID=UPI0036919E23
MAEDRYSRELSTGEDRGAATATTDAWEASLTQAFGVLLGRPLSDYDPYAGYGAYYGGNWLDETESNRDPAWLDPAALSGKVTIAMDSLLLDGDQDLPELRFDASRSLFEVDPERVPGAFAEDLAAAGLPSSGIIRGDALARLLDRHALTSSELPDGTWSVWQARIASDGTLLDALRVATGIGSGPDSLVPYDKPHVWAMDTEAEAAVAAVHDAGLRAHLRTFGEAGSHSLDHQAQPTRSGDWSGWQGDEWEEAGSLVTQWIGAVDQYTVSVVQHTASP